MPRQSILFLIDTQGANVLGCYTGNPAFGTPNIDRLAAGGVRFDRAYTCSPVCGPARSAIFTGLYPHTNGVLGNDMAPHADLPTVGVRLRDAGIRTGYIGKWHLDGSDYFGDGRCPDGWDPSVWFDGRNYLDSLPSDADRDLSRRMLDPGEVARHGITAEFTHAHRIADRARSFIERHKHEDFFLVVSIDEPHHPFICPEPFISRFQDFSRPVLNARAPLDRKPRQQREWAGPNHQANADGAPADHRHPFYYACNSFCDHEIGRVMEAVDAHAPGALVVHTSDHGDMFMSHGLSGKGPAMYEEIARIPLIVRWPGMAPAASASAELASHIDLVPTFLEFFGRDVPPVLHGRSLLSRFRNPGETERDAVFIDFNRFEIDHDGFGAFHPIRCVRDRRHKLSVNLLDTDELYDLEADPLEMDNLIDDPAHAAARDRLHDLVLDWQGRTRDPLRGPHWARRSWRDVSASAWTGPTRPRPLDPGYMPHTLLYETARPVTRDTYDKQ